MDSISLKIHITYLILIKGTITEMMPILPLVHIVVSAPFNGKKAFTPGSEYGMESMK